MTAGRMLAMALTLVIAVAFASHIGTFFSQVIADSMGTILAALK